MSWRASSTSWRSSRSTGASTIGIAWESASGQRFLRAGPGAFMWVPEGVPHAFANRTDRPARMFFQSSVPGGHENYFEELAQLLRAGGPPDPAAVADLRLRYGIEQLTRLSTVNR